MKGFLLEAEVHRHLQVKSKFFFISKKFPHNFFCIRKKANQQRRDWNWKHEVFCLRFEAETVTMSVTESSKSDQLRITQNNLPFRFETFTFNVLWKPNRHRDIKRNSVEATKCNFANCDKSKDNLKCYKQQWEVEQRHANDTFQRRWAFYCGLQNKEAH